MNPNAKKNYILSLSEKSPGAGAINLPGTSVWSTPKAKPVEPKSMGNSSLTSSNLMGVSGDPRSSYTQSLMDKYKTDKTTPGSNPIKQPIKTPTPSIPKVPTAPTAPVVPQDTEEERLRRVYDELTGAKESYRAGMSNIENQAIPMEDITGEQEHLSKLATNKISALSDKASAATDLYKMFNERQTVGEGSSIINPRTGEVIYKNPKTTAGGGSGGSGSGRLSDLALAVKNGTIAIDKLPAADRSRVAAELASSGSPTSRQQELNAGYQLVNELLNNPALSSISGLPSPGVFIPGTPAQMVKNQYNQLKGMLSLEARQALKGTGAISDFEFQILTEAASSLGRNLSDADFRKQLEKIRDVFEGKYRDTTAGATPTATSNLVTAPDGNEIEIID